ncbi:MAG: hypothetical protein ABIH92_04430 [Nanoarchaeota archaeon]
MPQTEERQALREHFIDAFVRTLILSSVDIEQIKAEEKAEKKEEDRKKLKALANKLENMLENPQEELEKINLPELPNVPKKTRPAPIHLPKQRHHLPKPTQKLQVYHPVPLPKQYQPPKSKPGQVPETINLGKITAPLLDPAVFSIECPGPAKNLLVNRSGTIQTTSIVLSKDEINQLMQTISEKTRIPLISGVFKAAYQDLIITAVVSDFVGTRFMIQKRTPFQRY